MVTRILIFLLVMLSSTQSLAVGFGSVELKSHLGEPLELYVSLTVNDEERKSRFIITLATMEEYQVLEQNIPKSHHLLRTDVIDRDGMLFVKVSSSYAVDESFLTLVIKVQRGRGNFYKQIPVLLNPRWHKAAQPTLPAAQESEKPAKTFSPIAKSPVLEGKPSLKPRIPSQSSNDFNWQRRASYGPVRSGDNLSEIAYRLRKDKRFSNQQVMLALFNTNKHAFLDHDIHRLKQGAFLKVPDLEAINAFLASPAYAALEVSLRQSTKVSKQIEPIIVVEEGASKQRFYSKVTLGLTESLEAQQHAINNAIVVSRLEKLEPLFDEVMTSKIRIDGIGNKLDDLETEVQSLRQQIESLAKTRMTQEKNESNFGWWWFFVLLIVNIFLILFFVYHRQKKVWQNKLEKAQYQGVYADSSINDDDSTGVIKEDVMLPPFKDNKHNVEEKDENTIGEETPSQSMFEEALSEVEEAIDTPEPLDDILARQPANYQAELSKKKLDAAVNDILNAPLIGLKNENIAEIGDVAHSLEDTFDDIEPMTDKSLQSLSMSVDKHDEGGGDSEEADAKLEEVEVVTQEMRVDHAACFEVAMQKGVWKAAESHYHAMFANIRVQPRIQALYIQMLHQEGRVYDRNNSLLDVYKGYDETKWSHFCSLFDDNIWHQLQDERVISFTGDVLVKGLEKSNERAEEMKILLAKSNLETSISSKGTLDHDPEKTVDETVILSAQEMERMLHPDELPNGDDTSIDLDSMDESGLEKWGKVEEVTDDDLMLEVDFDVGELLSEERNEAPPDVEYTPIDIEFTGEIELPLEEEAFEKKK